MRCLPAFGVTPYGACKSRTSTRRAYSESDVTVGGFGLSHNAMNATDVRSELGARFDDPTIVYSKPLILFGRVAWAHDLVSNPSLSAMFQSLPGASFNVNGASTPQNSALTTAGAPAFLSPQFVVARQVRRRIRAVARKPTPAPARCDILGELLRLSLG